MSEPRSIPGSAPDAPKRRLYVEAYQHWSGLNPFRRFNWRNFTLIRIEGEIVKYAGHVELDCCVLGVGCRVTYIYNFSFRERMNDTRAEIEAELMGRTGATEIVDLTGGEFKKMCAAIDAEKNAR